MRDLRLLDRNKITVAPSILSADFGNLNHDIARVAQGGADLLHVDVMDGHFVPNISIGPGVIKCIRRASDLIFDVHLMISEPLRYVEEFAAAGADHITFHLESNDDPATVIRAIRSLGCTAGISVKPGTPPEAVHPFLPDLDLVLVMTVEPGFGGQSFRQEQLSKIRALKQRIADLKFPIHLEVDGGIDADTAVSAAAAGANMLVAGTSVYRNPKGIAEAICDLKKASIGEL